MAVTISGCIWAEIQISLYLNTVVVFVKAANLPDFQRGLLLDLGIFSISFQHVLPN